MSSKKILNDILEYLGGVVLVEQYGGTAQLLTFIERFEGDESLTSRLIERTGKLTGQVDELLKETARLDAVIERLGDEKNVYEKDGDQFVSYELKARIQYARDNREPPE